MAIQDDIMAMLSQVSDAGDRATDRGRTGAEMYSQIADLLSGDNRSKAMREIAMLSGNPEMSIEEQMRYDPLTGSRVADIIEKYMDEVSEPLPDTAAAMPRPRPDMSVLPSPDTAPRTPVTIEQLQPLPPMPGAGPGEAGMLMVDDTGSAMQGQGMDEIREKFMSKSPRLQELLAQESMDGARPDPELRKRAADLQISAIANMEKQARQEGVYGTQGARLRAAAGEETGLSGALLAGRMGREATPEDEIASLITGGTSALGALPAGSLANVAMRLGIGRFSPQQIARNPQLRLQIEQEVRLLLPKPTAGAPSSYVAPSAQVGAQGRQAAQAAARARQAAEARARAAARGERSSQPIRIEQTPAQRLGSTQGSGSAFDDLINRLGPIGMAEGMSVRDKIMNTYGRM
jgi:hypothetical protein